ncbi:MAG TPA: DUF2911 domain-containing protein [Puia sp.]|nr:DUF2911 domain-containing protein [Puia sp.]
MKRRIIIRLAAFVFIGLLVSSHSWAQGDKSTRPSPPATAKGKIKDANITIDYSSPSVKGRTIWGSLVPYNKIWRAGANEATIFTTDKDVMVEGKKLPAGKYSLFMTPGEKEWTVIFNSQTGQWGIKNSGDANLDPAKNVLEVKVKPKTEKEVQEKLTYTIEDKMMDKGFSMTWDKVKVFVSVK